MATEINDPGTGKSFGSTSNRIINNDGSFNVKKKGAKTGFRDVFTYLTEVSWPKFFLLIFVAYFLINILFTLLFLAVGPEQVAGLDPNKNTFGQLLAFSFQTSTTVGYGALHPVGPGAQFIAATAAFFGFLSFSLATGLLYGRFSRPNPKILYSDNILYSKYKDGYALKLRLAHMRNTTLMDLHANVILATDRFDEEGNVMKNYYRLELERESILMLPLTWTIVHPIDNESPLFGKTMEEIKELKPEIMVTLKGFNEVYGQHIRSRHSYGIEDFKWNKGFKRIYHSDGDRIAFDLADINLTVDED